MFYCKRLITKHKIQRFSCYFIYILTFFDFFRYIFTSFDFFSNQPLRIKFLFILKLHYFYSIRKFSKFFVIRMFSTNSTNSKEIGIVIFLINKSRIF